MMNHKGTLLERALACREYIEANGEQAVFGRALWDLPLSVAKKEPPRDPWFREQIKRRQGDT